MLLIKCYLLNKRIPQSTEPPGQTLPAKPRKKKRRKKRSEAAAPEQRPLPNLNGGGHTLEVPSRSRNLPSLQNDLDKTLPDRALPPILNQPDGNGFPYIADDLGVD